MNERQELKDIELELSRRESEKLSQELGAGQYVPGISDGRRVILDIDIVKLIKEGKLADAERAVYAYRNQWVEMWKSRLPIVALPELWTAAPDLSTGSAVRILNYLRDRGIVRVSE